MNKTSTHEQLAELLILRGMDGELMLDNVENHIAYVKDRAEDLFPSENGLGPFGHIVPLQFNILFVDFGQVVKAACRMDLELCGDKACNNPRLSMNFFTSGKGKSALATFVECDKVNVVWNMAVSQLTTFICLIGEQLWGEGE